MRSSNTITVVTHRSSGNVMGKGFFSSEPTPSDGDILKSENSVRKERMYSLRDGYKGPRFSYQLSPEIGCAAAKTVQTTASLSMTEMRVDSDGKRATMADYIQGALSAHGILNASELPMMLQTKFDTTPLGTQEVSGKPHAKYKAQLAMSGDLPMRGSALILGFKPVATDDSLLFEPVTWADGSKSRHMLFGGYDCSEKKLNLFDKVFERGQLSESAANAAFSRSAIASRELALDGVFVISIPIYNLGEPLKAEMEKHGLPLTPEAAVLCSSATDTRMGAADSFSKRLLRLEQKRVFRYTQLGISKREYSRTKGISGGSRGSAYGYTDSRTCDSSHEEVVVSQPIADFKGVLTGFFSPAAGCSVPVAKQLGGFLSAQFTQLFPVQLPSGSTGAESAAAPAGCGGASASGSVSLSAAAPAGCGSASASGSVSQELRNDLTLLTGHARIIFQHLVLGVGCIDQYSRRGRVGLEQHGKLTQEDISKTLKACLPFINESQITAVSGCYNTIKRDKDNYMSSYFSLLMQASFDVLLLGPLTKACRGGLLKNDSDRYAQIYQRIFNVLFESFFNELGLSREKQVSLSCRSARCYQLPGRLSASLTARGYICLNISFEALREQGISDDIFKHVDSLSRLTVLTEDTFAGVIPSSVGYAFYFDLTQVLTLFYRKCNIDLSPLLPAKLFARGERNACATKLEYLAESFRMPAQPSSRNSGLFSTPGASGERPEKEGSRCALM